MNVRDAYTLSTSDEDLVLKGIAIVDVNVIGCIYTFIDVMKTRS